MSSTLTVLQFTRISEEWVRFPVTDTLADGTPAVITGVQCALLSYRSRGPSTSTVWKDAVWVAGTGGAPGYGKILVAGPDAADPGASGFQLGSYGGDLWARVVDNPEIIPSPVARIDLLTD